jgi:hypothetical protein
MVVCKPLQGSELGHQSNERLRPEGGFQVSAGVVRWPFGLLIVLLSTGLPCQVMVRLVPF